MFGGELTNLSHTKDSANLVKTDQRGIIPHFCEQLFEYINSSEAKEKKESYKV
jgi:hypothetical protein